MKLARHKGNPIIKPRGDAWEAVATFNCAAIYRDDRIHVLYRATGDYVHYASHLGYALFDESLNLLERPEEPIFGPDLKRWEMSIEPPPPRREPYGDAWAFQSQCRPPPAPPWPG